jgi:hypothetical protein
MAHAEPYRYVGINLKIKTVFFPSKSRYVPTTSHGVTTQKMMTDNSVLFVVALNEILQESSTLKCIISIFS